MNSGSFIIDRIRSESRTRCNRGIKDAFTLNITTTDGSFYEDFVLAEHIAGNGVITGTAKDISGTLWIVTANIQSVAVKWVG